MRFSPFELAVLDDVFRIQKRRPAGKKMFIFI